MRGVGRWNSCGTPRPPDARGRRPMPGAGQRPWCRPTSSCRPSEEPFRASFRWPFLCEGRSGRLPWRGRWSSLPKERSGGRTVGRRAVGRSRGRTVPPRGMFRRASRLSGRARSSPRNCRGRADPTRRERSSQRNRRGRGRPSRRGHSSQRNRRGWADPGPTPGRLSRGRAPSLPRCAGRRSGGCPAGRPGRRRRPALPPRASACCHRVCERDDR